METLHINRLMAFLRDRYPDDWDSRLDDENNYTRLLAKFAVESSLSSPEASHIQITDGENDYGIDAIGIDPQGNIVASQSKWKKSGKGSVVRSEMSTSTDGLRGLLSMTATLPQACTAATSAKIAAGLQEMGATVTFVSVTTGKSLPSKTALEPLNSFARSVNLSGQEPIFLHNHLALAEVMNLASLEAAGAPTFRLSLLGWSQAQDSPLSYYGRASAHALAQLHDQFGSRLFQENIRLHLKNSEINTGISDTIRNSPELFWNFNNGISIVCKKASRSNAGAASRDFAEFELESASIVNGAQTVSTLGKALSDGLTTQLDQAFVQVRLTQVDDDSSLTREITRKANIQNSIESQDFMFLDTYQHKLKADFVSCGYTYILRPGESADAGTKAITVREVVTALACATTPKYSTVVKREISRFYDPSTSYYQAVFVPDNTALLVAQAHQVVLSSNSALQKLAATTQGVENGVATHASYLIASLILERLGKKLLRSSDGKFENALATVPELATAFAKRIVTIFPGNSYPGSVFKNSARTQEIINSLKTPTGE